MKTVSLFKLFFIAIIFIGCSDSTTDDTIIIPNPPTGPPVTGTINGTLTFEGVERTFILYVPESHTGETTVPLVLNFHGYTSDAATQMQYCDFRSLADTKGFIVVHPQGTLYNGATHWNVGGWTVGSTVNDVGFTEALINHISTTYNINAEKVYATGMSNGGYMSFLLACELSDKIAAIASVTGSMTPETYENCNPQHPMPVLQMHGTADAVVPYNGASWTKPIETVLQYWVTYNNCDTSPITVSLADTNTTDNSTVETITYNNGNKDVITKHYKITGGTHTWPGSWGNMDINASNEIWEFFAKYDINGLIE